MDELEDINTFNEGMNFLFKAIECFRDVSDELISIEEFRKLESWYNYDLTERKINKEIELESYKMEVV